MTSDQKKIKKYEAIIRDMNCWCTRRKAEALKKLIGNSESYWLGAEASASVLQMILQDKLRDIGEYRILDCKKCEELRHD